MNRMSERETVVELPFAADPPGCGYKVHALGLCTSDDHERYNTCNSIGPTPQGSLRGPPTHSWGCALVTTTSGTIPATPLAPPLKGPFGARPLTSRTPLSLPPPSGGGG
jgi:hypothetical protein